jgi:hypothetical protein
MSDGQVGLELGLRQTSPSTFPNQQAEDMVNENKAPVPIQKRSRTPDKLDAHGRATINKINHHTTAASLLSNSGWAFPYPEHTQ